MKYHWAFFLALSESKMITFTISRKQNTRKSLLTLRIRLNSAILTFKQNLILI